MKNEGTEINVVSLAINSCDNDGKDDWDTLIFGAFDNDKDTVNCVENIINEDFIRKYLCFHSMFSGNPDFIVTKVEKKVDCTGKIFYQCEADGYEWIDIYVKIKPFYKNKYSW